MLGLRKTFATLAIVGLLLSNTAGWLHVHLHHHDLADHAHATPAAATVSPASSPGSSCCHHGHHHCSPPETAADSSQPAGSADPPHDSEDCATCQLFLALRHGATSGLTAEVQLDQPAPVASAPLPDDPAPALADPRPISVRGPPMV